MWEKQILEPLFPVNPMVMLPVPAEIMWAELPVFQAMRSEAAMPWAICPAKAESAALQGKAATFSTAMDITPLIIQEKPSVPLQEN